MSLTRFPVSNHVLPSRLARVFHRSLIAGALTLALSPTANALQADNKVHNKADRQNYTNAQMCYHLARESVFDQRYNEKSLSYCNRALRFENLSAENRSRTYINRGVLLKNMARIRYAEGDFRRAQKTMHPTGDIQINLGNMAYLRGQFEQAAKRYSKALAMGVDTPYKAYLNRGLANERLGNHEAALRDYRQALADNPDLQPAKEQLLGMTHTRHVAQSEDRQMELLQQQVASLY